MGEISEALVRARKESKGRQHATRAGRRPVSLDSDGDGTDPNPPSDERFGSDLAEAEFVDSDDSSQARDQDLAGRASIAAVARDALSLAEVRAAEMRAPSGELSRLREMTESGRAPQIPTPADASDVEHHEIPRERSADWVARLCAVDPQGPEAVRFRHLAVKLRSMLDQRNRRSILVTSALPGEGKTTVSVNLALALASIAPEYRIALVDMDLRRGRVAHALGYASPVGLEKVLSGTVPLDAARVATDLPSLDFYPISRSMPDAHRLLGDSARKFLDDLNRKYDYVVIDAPPVLPVPEIPLLAPHVGGCLVVVASGRTRQAAFADLLEHLPRHSILGVFLNRSRSAISNKRYAYYEAVAVEDEAGSEEVAPS